MEERKLIKQGGGGLTIYLPKKWLDRKGLKEGDKVSVIEDEGSLIIEGKVNKKNEIIIGINESNINDLRHLLTHAYRRGFSRIIINHERTERIIKEVKKVVSNVLLGFELTKIEGNELLIENISEPSEEKYEVMMQKVFLVISETMQLMSNDFSKGKFDDANEMKELRDQSDKFIIFCKRLLSKNKHERNLLFEWEFLTFMMDIQHTCYYLYHYCYDNKIKGTKEMIAFSKELESYFSHLKTAYNKKDAATVHKINELKKKYHFGDITKMIEKSRGKESSVYAYFREVFRSIQLSTSPIMSMSFKY
ncbi:hypothetical protein J4447_01285 [Candidatus Pacearchaeota archaeon]|nr:hypothetical protein [Candidatus Pacearchaeota archaeon]